MSLLFHAINGRGRVRWYLSFIWELRKILLAVVQAADVKVQFRCFFYSDLLNNRKKIIKFTFLLIFSPIYLRTLELSSYSLSENLSQKPTYVACCTAFRIVVLSPPGFNLSLACCSLSLWIDLHLHNEWKWGFLVSIVLFPERPICMRVFSALCFDYFSIFHWFYLLFLITGKIQNK